MKKILLINPRTPDTFWNFKHILKFISRKAVYPPLGLLTIASLLPSDWEKKLIDLKITELSDSEIEWADLILISAMMIQKESANEIINRCHKIGKIILAGGPLFSVQPEKFSKVNHLFVGEAEETLTEFIDDYKNGVAKKIYEAADFPDLKKTPIPMWNLINFKDYVTMTLQFSRGCPFDCEFCGVIAMNGRKTRVKSSGQFISELESLYVTGWRGTIFIVDDNFIGNKKEVKFLLNEIIDWQKTRRFPYKFLTQASVNLGADEELMRLMSEANFFKVFLGLETPSESSLEECNKIQNLKGDIPVYIKNIQNHGMQVMGGFVIGFDNDDSNIFGLQKKFIENTGVVTAMVGILTALPGTRLYQRLKEEGRLTGDSSGANTEVSGLNFIPKNMSREELVNGYKKLIKCLYSDESFYKRIENFLSSYRPTVKSGRISSVDIKALFCCLVIIGFSSSFFYFWGNLLKTMIKKTKSVPVFIELVIQGYHYKKMAKNL